MVDGAGGALAKALLAGRPPSALYIGSISASPTACLVRGYGLAGTQNDRVSEQSRRRARPFKSVYKQMARAHRTDAECDDVDRAHRARWGEPNGLGAGTAWSKEADLQWCQARVQRRNSQRASRRASTQAQPSNAEWHRRGLPWHDPRGGIWVSNAALKEAAQEEFSPGIIVIAY